MSDVIGKLVERLSVVCQPVSDSSQLIQLWASEPLPLSVWDTWTLLTLVRHRSRQQFVADTIRFRLNADLRHLAAGALGHPNCPQHGLVPGLTDWEYYFHGQGCCLTHRVTGEEIDVDFCDDTADWFDRHFFVNYLESLKAPEFAEQRLIELHNAKRTVLLAFDSLLQARLLERHQEHGVRRLAFQSDQLAEVLARAEMPWANGQQRVLIAAAVGDWCLVSEQSADRDLRSLADSLSREAKKSRTKTLVNAFESAEWKTEALEALDDLGSDQLPGYLARALAGPPSGAVSAALEIISRTNEPTWCDPVYQLWKRTDPGGPLPQPHIWLTCVRFLLQQRNHFEEVCERIRNADAQSIGEAALVALEHAPEHALNLFRRALRSDIPHNRIVAASILATLDQPWSRRELTEVLEESTDQLPTAECRSALMETHSEEAHQIVTKWEELNPREPERGEWISGDEMTLRNSDETIRWEMQERHDHVMKLRNIVPPKPDG